MHLSGWHGHLGANPYRYFRTLLSGSDLTPTWPRINQGKQPKKGTITQEHKPRHTRESQHQRELPQEIQRNDTETRKQNSEIAPRTHEPMHCFSRGWTPRGFFQIRAFRVQVLFGAYVVSCGFQPSFKFRKGDRLQMETCDTSGDHALPNRSVV